MGIFYKDGNGKQEMRIGLLSDTGGAFTPNLSQLDYYAGVFNTRAQFNREVRTLPAFAEAYFFIKKETCFKISHEGTKAQR
jgi:hypothetical protein